MAKRILIVDDSASIRQVEKVVLSGAGYEVVEAKDGEEAVKLLQTTQVALIFTDLNMPKLDGIGLLRWVRKSPQHRLTPVVTVTTESDEAKKREGKIAGATGWIVKPFSPEQLLTVAKRVLG